MRATRNRVLPGVFALVFALGALACGASETPQTAVEHQEATGASTVTLAITGMT